MYPRSKRNDLENAYQFSKKLIYLSTALKIEDKDVNVALERCV